MSNVLQLNQPAVGVGLNTYTFTIPAASAAYPFGGAGLYNVTVGMTYNAYIIGNGAGSGSPQTTPTVTSSGLTYTVVQNSTTLFTSPTPGPYQTAEQSKTQFLAAVADVITITFSSTTPIDLQNNSVQTIVTINQGL